MFTEQLNIEGKRSGKGFVVHKAMLVSALSRALSERVTLIDLNIGRKGLLGYLKAISGSNIVKIVPASNGAGDTQTKGHKGLKVICGSNTGYLEDMAWIGEKTPLTLCEVRVSPKNTVQPNIGASELAEALNRVLPFTTTDDNRPVLQCAYFVAKEGKLTIVSADGFTLAVVTLDYDEGTGQALIKRDDLMGVANALRKAKRVRVSFDGETHIPALAIDTELIRYKFTSADGTYPAYDKLIPTDFHTFAHFDTVEAIKAVSSLKVLADSKGNPIDLTIGDGKIVMGNPDDKGQAELSADTEGEGKVRVDGNYLAKTLKACGGMVDFKLTSPAEPMLFSSDGYQVVIMPMMVGGEKKTEAKAEPAKPAEEPEPKPKGEDKGKGKVKQPAKPEVEIKNKAEKPPATKPEKPKKVLAGVA